MDQKRPHVETGRSPHKPPKKRLTPADPSVKNLWPRVDQAQAQTTIDAENHAAPPEEQPQEQPEVPARQNGELAPAPTSHSEPGVDQDQAAIQAENNVVPPPAEVPAQPNAEPVPAPTSHSEPLATSEEEDKFRIIDTDLTWMKVALAVASRAETSEHAKEKPNVGCVIRRSRSKGPPAVLAVGWNGFPPTMPEDILRDKAAEYDRKRKRHGLTNDYGVHAETNALQYCSEGAEKATVYVTHVPCYNCAKQLVSHRVKRVFYLFWMGKSETSIQLFQEFDISCIPFPGKKREVVLSVFRENFVKDHKILAGSTTQDIPKEGSFYLSTEDSRSDVSDFKRFLSDDFSLIKHRLEQQGDKVDKILQEIHEYRNQHNIKILGVPEETALDTSSLCVALFTKMGAKITISDIDTAQRTTEGRDSKGPRPIICKFVRRLAKDSVMSVKQKACKVNPEEIAGFSKDTNVSKIRICDYDEDTQEKTEEASSTQ